MGVVAIWAIVVITTNEAIIIAEDMAATKITVTETGTEIITTVIITTVITTEDTCGTAGTVDPPVVEAIIPMACPTETADLGPMLRVALTSPGGDPTAKRCRKIEINNSNHKTEISTTVIIHYQSKRCRLFFELKFLISYK